MRRLWVHIAALVGAFVGFYVGLFTLLGSQGLGSAEWAPLFMSTGAGLLAGGAVAVVSESATAKIAAIGVGGGALLGAFFTAINPDLTIIAILLAVFSQALAYLPEAVELGESRA